MKIKFIKNLIKYRKMKNLFSNRIKVYLISLINIKDQI